MGSPGAVVEAHARPVTEVRPVQAAEADLSSWVVRRTRTGEPSFDPQNRGSRQEERVSQPTVTPGLRDWIAELPGGSGRLAAAFDTRINEPVLLTGSAPKGIGRRLERQGYRLVVDPECFLVSTDNRLLEGEIEQAIRWGSVAAAASAASTAVAARTG